MSVDPPGTRPQPRIRLSTPTEADLAGYRRAVEGSLPRLSRYSPVGPDTLAEQLTRQSRDHRTFLIRALHPMGDHDLVGTATIGNVVRGRGCMGTLGYLAFDPYAGKGLFREGLAAVMDVAFAAEPDGMGLHRLEANVQPRNVRSAGVLRSLGFVYEGFSPRLVYLPDATGEQAWRDHDRYALLAEDHPSAPYRIAPTRRIVALVNGLPGSGKTTLAQSIAMRLGVPLLSKDTIKECVADGMGPSVYNEGPGSPLGAGASIALWELLRLSPTGGIVESWFDPRQVRYVRAGLERARLDPSDVPELWCDVPVELARSRFEERGDDGSRRPVHGPQVHLDAMWTDLADANHPMGLGPLLRVGTTEPLTVAALTDLCLQLRAWNS